MQFRREMEPAPPKGGAGFFVANATNTRLHLRSANDTIGWLMDSTNRGISMRSIAVFNNKGGVGKTTLLCNLAAFLGRELNKRVLVIDADPQCNATQNMFSDETILDFYKKKASFTIYDIVKPLSSGRGFATELKVLPSQAFKVDVLPGDPRLALTEDLLATDWGQAMSGNTRGLRTTYLFSQLLSRCRKYDYVIFDMGPSLGSINRAVLISSDFFITPMSIDIFSLRAIDNISLSLDKWKKQLEHALKLLEDPDELEVEDPAWKLKFAGYVTQQYTAKTAQDGQRRAVLAYDRILKDVPNTIQKHLVEKLQPEMDELDYHLGSIPHLHSLIPMSQTSRRPIFALRSADGVVGAHFAKVREYKDTISHLTEHLIDNLERLS